MAPLEKACIGAGNDIVVKRRWAGKLPCLCSSPAEVIMWICAILKNWGHAGKKTLSVLKAGMTALPPTSLHIHLVSNNKTKVTTLWTSSPIFIPDYS